MVYILLDPGDTKFQISGVACKKLHHQNGVILILPIYYWRMYQKLEKVGIGTFFLATHI